MLILLLFAAAFALAYWNGANDNFKGVATLYGSGTFSYRTALGIATVATLLGSISAIFLAQGIIVSFSGKGLVAAEVAGSALFLTAVGLGAATTVLIATWTGLPISTTHSLVGGLLGAGLLAAAGEVQWPRLGTAFVLPLLVSPLLALLLGGLCYGVCTRLRRRLGLNKESCLCIGEARHYVPLADLRPADQPTAAVATLVPGTLVMTLDERAACVERYTGRVWGLQWQQLLDAAHSLSGALVCFARGLNDTPKIAGLLVAAQLLAMDTGMLVLALGMAAGGLLHSHRVAETISHRITALNHGQGFAANLVTALLVIFASKMGLPVSTTHVSVGAIFGIGLYSRRRNGPVMATIVLSWLLTLPLALLLSALYYALLSASGLL